MDSATIETTVVELAARPGHEKVRSLLYILLRDGLGANSIDIDFQAHTPEVQGRIDALLDGTVFEVKTDQRRERHDAETQLARYLPQKEAEAGRHYIGVATDGAAFQAYELRERRPDPSASAFPRDPSTTIRPRPDRPTVRCGARPLSGAWMSIRQ